MGEGIELRINVAAQGSSADGRGWVIQSNSSFLSVEIRVHP